MKKLSKDIKNVLTGLTCQNAGELLSAHLLRYVPYEGNDPSLRNMP